MKHLRNLLRLPLYIVSGAVVMPLFVIADLGQLAGALIDAAFRRPLPSWMEME